MEPQQELSPAEEPAAEETDSVSDHSPTYSWEASEFVHHDKAASWYVGLWVAAIIMAAIMAYFHQWSSIAVVLAAAVALMIYSRKEPRTLSYTIDSAGISIGNKRSGYELFHSYNVRPEVGWHEIDLEPARRFAPRITLLVDDESFDDIERILALNLPRADRDPDIVERFARYIRF